MSKFWQKKYISKYTGAEIDAAVAKAGDATKVTANPTLAGTESALEGLQVGDTKYKVGGDIPLVNAPQVFETAVTTALQSLAAGLAADIKLHKTTFSFNTEDAGFADVVSFFNSITNITVRVLCGNIGLVYVEAMFDGVTAKSCLKNYIILPGLGMGEIILLLNETVEGTVITKINCDVYARRIDQAV